MNAEREIKQILEMAGIEVGGGKPWDPVIHDLRVFRRVSFKGSLGLGEAYMDGWWDAPRLDEFFMRLLDAFPKLPKVFVPAALPGYLIGLIINQQSKSRAFEVGKRHYDIGNDIYRAMLDTRMTYTCGYWSPSRSGQAPKNLDEAQEAKLDLTCRKLGLKKGDRVLDIGCGWGSFLKFAAEKYGAEGVGVTVSHEQVALARELCIGLPVEILLEDYRDVRGMFDHVVSLGMFEHVGFKNYRTYMNAVHRSLRDGGLFLLHTIGGYGTGLIGDPWVTKYIFPNSTLPTMAQISRAIDGLFVMEDWHNFGADYDRTLMAWYENFDRAWPALKEKYGERFYRMWKYYLMQFAGSFRARRLQLWQIVLSKQGVRGGYISVR